MGVDLLRSTAPSPSRGEKGVVPLPLLRLTMVYYTYSHNLFIMNEGYFSLCLLYQVNTTYLHEAIAMSSKALRNGLSGIPTLETRKDASELSCVQSRGHHVHLIAATG